MKKFRLIGRTIVFVVVREYTILDGVPCVEGHSIDGEWATQARIADVIFLN